MSETPLENAPDLDHWKKENPKLKGRGFPRICECGAVVMSKTLMECPICRGLLPKIEVMTTSKKEKLTKQKKQASSLSSDQKQSK